MCLAANWHTWVIGCSFKFRQQLTEIAPLFLCSTSATSFPLHPSHSVGIHSFSPFSLYSPSNQYCPSYRDHVEGTWINKSMQYKRSFLNDSFEMKIKSCSCSKHRGPFRETQSLGFLLILITLTHNHWLACARSNLMPLATSSQQNQGFNTNVNQVLARAVELICKSRRLFRVWKEAYAVGIAIRSACYLQEK